jgi:hypothetical protein
MKVSTLITDVRRELVETTAAFWPDAELLRHFNRGMMDFVNRTRILEDRAFMDTQVGRADYPLPSNWLSVRGVMHNTPNSDGTANWNRLHPSNLEKFIQERPNFLDTSTNAQDKPRFYMIWGKTLYIYPAPSTANSSSSDLCLWYKSKPLDVTNTNTDIEIDDVLAEAVTEYMLWKAWLKEGEDEKAIFHRKEYYDMVGEGLRWSKRQSGDQRIKIDIESSQGFYGGPTTGFNPLG